jgi:peptidoglycan hydrolase-like protein with peptidoglycan-binding domain
MRLIVTVLFVSALWLGPVMAEAGTAGTGEQRPEQREILSKDTLNVVQQRLQAEGVYSGPLDGELNAQTQAALRQYQAKQQIPVSGAPDPETLKELQIRPPAGSPSQP